MRPLTLKAREAGLVKRYSKYEKNENVDISIHLSNMSFVHLRQMLASKSVCKDDCKNRKGLPGV